MRDKLHSDTKDSSLAQRLGPDGRKAFEKLCRGCDRSILGDLFLFLTAPSPLQLESGREIHLRRMDAEHLLSPIGFDGLKKIVLTAQTLVQDLTRLRKTPLVQHLLAQGAFQPGDLLYRATMTDSVPVAFRGLLELPKKARKLSSINNPDYTRLLTKIYKHIYAHTGQWRDALVADVLNALSQYPALYNAGMLKQWRWRNELRSEGTRNRSFRAHSSP